MSAVTLIDRSMHYEKRNGLYVRQAHARGQHLHPDLVRVGLRTLLFNHLQNIRSAVVGDDDSRMSHEMVPSPDGSGLFENHVTMSVIRLTVNYPVRLETSNWLTCDSLLQDPD